MVSLALASMLLFDVPKLNVPTGKGKAEWQMGKEEKPFAFDSLTLGEVNALAKGFVDKPKAKLFVTLGPKAIEASDKGRLWGMNVGGLSPEMLSVVIPPSERPQAGAFVVRLSGLKAGKRYVAVFKGNGFGETPVSFQSAATSGEMTIPNGWSNFPVAFTPKASNDWFVLQVLPSNKPKTPVYYGLAAIEVYALE